MVDHRLDCGHRRGNHGDCRVHRSADYRTSLRLQTLALEDVDVTLFTRRSAGDANSQITLTQEAFSNIVQSPLVTWRRSTIWGWTSAPTRC